MSSQRNNCARLYLLGHPRLELPCGSEVHIPSRKGAALIALVATADRAEHSRVWLQQMLWGSRPQKQAQTSLRRELANLRKALDQAGLAILVCEQRVIRIVTENLWIDLDHLDEVKAGSACDFLEGMDIPGEEAFEDWLREMRSSVFDVRGNALVAETAATVIPWPTAYRPVLAMMPALTTSSDADIINLSHQISGSLAELLPRIRWLPVMPMVSAPAADEAPLSAAALAREQGARYVLRTEVIDRASMTAVNFAMVEMPDQVIRWSDTRMIAPDIGADALVREIARVANCVSETFDLSEQRHVIDTQSEDPDLNLVAWKIRFHLNQFTRIDFDAAAALIEASLARYPANGELLMLRANLALWQHWIERTGPEGAEVLAPLIRAAMRADPADARGPMYMGVLETWTRQSASAINHLEHATRVDPSLAAAFSHLGAAHYLAGNAEAAIGPLKHALFLSPLDPKRFHTVGQLATALWMLGRYDEALERVSEIRQTHPGYVLAQIIETASLYGLGDARGAAAARRRITSGDRSLYLSALDWMPFIEQKWLVRLRNTIDSIGDYARIDPAVRAVLKS